MGQTVWVPWAKNTPHHLYEDCGGLKVSQYSNYQPMAKDVDKLPHWSKTCKHCLKRREREGR